ncbi:c-type cytochrome [Falsiroseomonas sp. E2-1-a20]|uniref:c-type cytochrome n=1 Tax=Falsiroseomonas sp. E2-1-a20 TaxID=3239300 RepID=UPI003F3DBA8D
MPARSVVSLAVVAVMAALMLPRQTAAQPRPHVPGAEAYRLACAQCHGADGRGDGPLRELLSIKAPDLTTLRQRNNGEFPFERILKMVDGRERIAAHGTPEMPAWGAVFSLEASDRLDAVRRETYVRGRIVELVGFVAELQR